MMNISIIGAGALGSNLASAMARSGVDGTISNSRGPHTIEALADELGPGIKAVSVADALKADMVVLAVPWMQLTSLLSDAPAWDGRLVVDATNAVVFLHPDSPDANDPTNPLAAYGLKAIDIQGRISSEMVQQMVPGAHVVKAFNHMEAEYLREPLLAGGRRVAFYSGDNLESKAETRRLIEAIGLAAVDLGALRVGASLSALPFGPLAQGPFLAAAP